MRTWPLATRALLLVASLIILNFAGRAFAATPAIALAQYAADLDRLRSSIEQLDERRPDESLAIVRQVPIEWVVQAGNRPWTLSGVWLRSGLEEWRRHPVAAARRRMADRLGRLRSDALGYSANPADLTAASGQLSEILSRREFAGLAGPGWFAQWRARVLQWIASLLARLIGSSSLPTIANIAVYGLIGLAVIVVAFWFYRWLQRTTAQEATALNLQVAPPRPWHDWLADARAAADAGRWRDAVHVAYWCGIVFLESRGAWKPDPSRTPREYLRALPESSAGAPALGALTSLLERVWYGTVEATPARFDEALACLRTIGCPVA